MRPRTCHLTGYANWQSDEVESLVIVGSTPTWSLNPWSNGSDIQESDGSIPSGITCMVCRCSAH